MAIESSVPCACGARSGEGAHSTAVDPEVKHSISTRLRRIEGQVRGLQKMVEEERYCADVLMQLSSVQEALRGVGRGLLHNHLKYCVAEAIRSHDQEQADVMYDELMELMYKNAR
ncbi:MAG TPA: metal-sensitive transcriptional regulator [Gemmatimonadales bacterium]|nr:metal-sensitive transcriptional regulator [Gemmatimonadales bacterium]